MREIRYRTREVTDAEIAALRQSGRPIQLVETFDGSFVIERVPRLQSLFYDVMDDLRAVRTAVRARLGRSRAGGRSLANGDALVVRAPGAFMDRFARLVFPRKVYLEVFAQFIADLRDEHAEALSANDRILARAIRIRSVVYFTEAVLLNAPVIKRILALLAGIGSGRTARK